MRTANPDGRFGRSDVTCTEFTPNSTQTELRKVAGEKVLVQVLVKTSQQLEIRGENRGNEKTGALKLLSLVLMFTTMPGF